MASKSNLLYIIMAIVVFVILYYVFSHKAFKMRLGENPKCYTVAIGHPQQEEPKSAHYKPCGSTTRIIGNGTVDGDGNQRFNIAASSDFGYHSTTPTSIMLLDNEYIMTTFNINYK